MREFESTSVSVKPQPSSRCESLLHSSPFLRVRLTTYSLSLTRSTPVNAPDADISFVSSDNVIFRVHRVHLDSHAEGFPPSSLDLPNPHELIPLSETSDTLEILFQHIYPRSYPCLDGMEFEELGRLAEAAEKYQIYAAMEVCRIHMRCASSLLEEGIVSGNSSEGWTGMQ